MTVKGDLFTVMITLPLKEPPKEPEKEPVSYTHLRAGDGLVTKGVEETIRNIGILAREGMRETDREILHIMCV